MGVGIHLYSLPNPELQSNHEKNISQIQIEKNSKMPDQYPPRLSKTMKNMEGDEETVRGSERTKET